MLVGLNVVRASELTTARGLNEDEISHACERSASSSCGLVEVRDEMRDSPDP